MQCFFLQGQRQSGRSPPKTPPASFHRAAPTHMLIVSDSLVLACTGSPTLGFWLCLCHLSIVQLWNSLALNNCDLLPTATHLAGWSWHDLKPTPYLTHHNTNQVLSCSCKGAPGCPAPSMMICSSELRYVHDSAKVLQLEHSKFSILVLVQVSSPKLFQLSQLELWWAIELY